ncbi:DUF2142 domain-containing protein [bacterium]|nr:DUF2142 domain-containing protein [candidate division CSSED10-310 bacterium]
MKCEKLFVQLAALFGVLFALITPPFQVPDEGAHFRRSYITSELKIFEYRDRGCVGHDLPRSVIAVSDEFHEALAFKPSAKIHPGRIFESLNTPLDPGIRMFCCFPNTAVYTPLVYLPQAAGILIGRCCSLSPLILMYLARLLNLTVWMILVATAIRITPVGKWVFFFLGLMPMTLFEAASVSADSLTIGSSFIYTAFLLRSSLEDTPVRWKWFAVLIPLTLIQLLVKQGYILLTGLIFMIPAGRFGSIRKYLVFTGSYLAGSFAVVKTWSVQIRDISPPPEDVFPPEQIRHILSGWNILPEVFLNTLDRHFLPYVKSFVGTLGWLDTHLNTSFIYFYLAILILASLIKPGTSSGLRFRHKALMATVLCASTFMIFVVLYIRWTPPKLPIISGLQGRYFIPLAPLFFMLFSSSRVGIATDSKWVSPAAEIISILSLGYALGVIVMRYYII